MRNEPTTLVLRGNIAGAKACCIYENVYYAKIRNHPKAFAHYLPTLTQFLENVGCPDSQNTIRGWQSSQACLCYLYSRPQGIFL